MVILARNSAQNFLGEVTIAPITSTVRDILTEVLLDQQDGLKNICAINLDHIQSVSKDKIGGYIPKFSDSKLDEIKTALLFALGFDC